MPSLVKVARKWIEWADVVNLHLPQFEVCYSASSQRSRKTGMVTSIVIWSK
jgi:hypothetical protein